MNIRFIVPAVTRICMGLKRARKNKLKIMLRKFVTINRKIGNETMICCEEREGN